MKKEGFTLIELLAVIVVLGIIMLIAVTAVNGVITKSRLSSFNTSSKMLEKAASTYINASNTIVATGTTTTVLYSDLKSSGYMNQVVDPISKNECTNSRVYVTNTNGTYTYKGALACDNYMDIDAYNLVTNGEFSNGATGWNGMTAGASIDATAGIDGGACGKVVYNGSVPSIVAQTSFNLVNGHKYYGSGWFKRIGNLGTSGGNQFDVGNVTPEMDFVNLNNTNLPQENTWYKLSAIATATASGISYNARFFSVYETTTIYGDNIIVLDLTAIYGAGNEPAIAQMNKIISNMSK